MGRFKLLDSQLAVVSWQLAVVSGQWAVVSGQWAVGSGQLAVVISFPVASELYSFLQPEERYRSYHTDATGFDISWQLAVVYIIGK
jgi:hypothetical protein